MQVPGGDNAEGLLSDFFWPELMSEEKERLLEKMKAKGTIFELNLILSEIFISEWTLSLMWNNSSTKAWILIRYKN